MLKLQIILKELIVKIYKTILFLILPTSYMFASPLSLSLSTNGKYAVSADGNNHAYLYNLDKHTIKDLGDDYNYRSAYFIPNTDNYLLQNKDTNEVTVSNINGKTVYKFNPKLQANSNAMSSNLKYYAISDGKNNTYIIYPKEKQKSQLIYHWCMGDPNLNKNMAHECGSLKPDSFEFTKDSKKLIDTTSSFLYIWDTESTEGKIIGENSGATMNAIDPNGQFVYTADQQYGGIKYNLNDNKTVQNLFYYPQEKENVSYESYGKYNKKDYFNGISNYKFIDEDRIIATFKGVSQSYLWAGLFKPSDYKKSGNHDTTYSIKYLALTKDPMKFLKGNYRDNTDPFPIVGGYNTTFDTSVEAHKLVMAQANGNGIMVYNYNPKDESLKLDWVGVPAKAEEKKEEKKGWFW